MSIENVGEETRGQYWSQVARDYDRSWKTKHVERTLYKDIEASLLAEFGSIGSERKVLELCCGCGRNSLALANTGAEIVGIDAAEGMLDVARQNAIEERVENVAFIQGDSRSLPFPDQSFDTVVGTRFMYMMSPVEKRAIIAGAHRVLRPKGRLVLQFNNGFWGVKEELKHLITLRPRPLAHRYLWPGQARTLFRGFRIQAIVGIKFFRLGLFSHIAGRERAVRWNRLGRCPGLRWMSAYLLVAAEKE